LISATRLERLLLLRPAGGELVARGLRLGQLALDRLAHLLLLLLIAASSISSWPHAPLGLVELEGRGVDLQPAAATRPRRSGRSPCPGSCRSEM
jgi:hypothetical protein